MRASSRIIGTKSSLSEGVIVSSGLMFNLDAGNISSYPGSGTTWTDLSGNGRNATLSTTTYSSSNGGSIVFDGSSSIGTMSSIGSQSTYTIDVWFNPSSLPNNYGCIISDIYPSYVNFKIGYEGTGIMTGGVYNGAWYNTPGTSISANTWHNLVLTHNGSTITLYKNNTAVGSSGSASGLTSGSGIRIGRRWDLADYFAGGISCIRFYNRVLNSTELLQNFNSIRSRYGI